MGYVFSGGSKTHIRSLIEVLHRFRWEQDKGERFFEGYDVNLLIETAVDELRRLEDLETGAEALKDATVPVRDVVVLRGVPSDDAHLLSRLIGPGVAVIAFPSSTAVGFDSLGEEEMRALGWVRA